MASILDRYGIKEVADVTFYKINPDTAKPDYPVLYLDTLKVSTIEQTAENVEAKGGKGNASLISWDYGKEINVTIEDALFSAKSMAIMFGNGQVKAIKTDSNYNAKYLMKTEQFKATGTQLPSEGNSLSGWNAKFEGPDGKIYTKINPQFFGADGSEVNDALEEGKKYFCTYDLKVSGSVIEISANSFPGTYYVTGDTWARSDDSGDDEFFQFIIPKAKVTSENTITLEAEGDPSVFNMNLRVLRPADGIMMKLVKYELTDEDDAEEELLETTLIHNHNLAQEGDSSINVINETEAISSGVAVNHAINTSGADSDIQAVVSLNTGIATAALGSSDIEITPVSNGTTYIKCYNSNGMIYKSIKVTVTGIV